VASCTTHPSPFPRWQRTAAAQAPWQLLLPATPQLQQQQRPLAAVAGPGRVVVVLRSLVVVVF
jgi:hypothetical protein